MSRRLIPYPQTHNLYAHGISSEAQDSTDNHAWREGAGEWIRIFYKGIREFILPSMQNGNLGVMYDTAINNEALRGCFTGERSRIFATREFKALCGFVNRVYPVWRRNSLTVLTYEQVEPALRSYCARCPHGEVRGQSCMEDCEDFEERVSTYIVEHVEGDMVDFQRAWNTYLTELGLQRWVRPILRNRVLPQIEADDPQRLHAMRVMLPRNPQVRAPATPPRPAPRPPAPQPLTNINLNLQITTATPN